MRKNVRIYFSFWALAPDPCPYSEDRAHALCTGRWAVTTGPLGKPHPTHITPHCQVGQIQHVLQPLQVQRATALLRQGPGSLYSKLKTR